MARDADSPTGRSKQDPPSAWTLLDGPSGPDPVSNYVAARFAGSDPDASTSADATLWGCWDQAVNAGRAAAEPLIGAWGLRLTRLTAFAPLGSATSSQLEIDSAIAALDAGEKLDACWGLVRARLPAWQPAYVPEMAARKWPSPAQQVCAEACLDAFALVGERSLTPGGDLGRCAGGPDAPLTLPWNGGEQASAAEICAFHLLAQERVVDADHPLPMAGGAQVWAGDTGDGRAGADNGLAVVAVTNLETRAGQDECAAAALQCFHGEALARRFRAKGAVLSSWEQRWESGLLSLALLDRSDLAARAPWCAAIGPWLRAATPEAEIDAPCRVGVERARDTVPALFAAAREGR